MQLYTTVLYGLEAALIMDKEDFHCLKLNFLLLNVDMNTFDLTISSNPA